MTGTRRYVPFDEVFEDVSSGQPKTYARDFLATGRYPLVDQGKALIGGYTDDPTKLSTATRPLIVFGDHTRAVKYVDFPFGVGADGVKLFRPKHDADVRYLYWVLRTTPIPASGYSRHTKFLKRMTVPLPPLSEQLRIARVLDQADELRSKRREAIDRLDRLDESLILETISNGASKAVALSEISSLKRGPFGGALRKDIFVDHGYKVYEQRNAIYGDLTLGTYFITPDKYKEMSGFALASNDLIVSCSGTVGKSAIVPSTFTPGIINQALLRIRVDDAAVLPIYLKRVLDTPQVQRQLRRFVHGSGLQNFPSMSEVKSIEIPLIPISAQELFLKQERRTQQFRSLLQSSATSLDRLFASLRHRALRGEL